MLPTNGVLILYSELLHVNEFMIYSTSWPLQCFPIDDALPSSDPLSLWSLSYLEVGLVKGADEVIVELDNPEMVVHANTLVNGVDVQRGTQDIGSPAVYVRREICSVWSADITE